MSPLNLNLRSHDVTTEVIEALTRLAASPILQRDDAEPLSDLITLADAGLIHDLDKHLEDYTPLERFLCLEVTGSVCVEAWPGKGFKFSADHHADDAALAVAGFYDIWFGDIRVMWEAPRYMREQVRIEGTPEYKQQLEERLRVEAARWDEYVQQHHERYAEIVARRSTFHLV